MKASLTPRFRMAEHSIATKRGWKLAGNCFLVLFQHHTEQERLRAKTRRAIPRYLSAPTLFATSSPWLYLTIGFAGGWGSGLSPSFSSVSSLRSHFSATRTILAPAQCSAISAIHFDSMFSRESLLSTYIARHPVLALLLFSFSLPFSLSAFSGKKRNALNKKRKERSKLTLKHSIMTCVSSYDRARRRSYSSCPAVSQRDSSI